MLSSLHMVSKVVSERPQQIYKGHLHTHGFTVACKFALKVNKLQVVEVYCADQSVLATPHDSQTGNHCVTCAVTTYVAMYVAYL